MCNRFRILRLKYLLIQELDHELFAYGHISCSSSIDVAKPRSLLSVTTFKGSVHLDIAAGAQSSTISLDDTNDDVPLVS